MSVARFAFGPRLKAHRERQGITLQDIADSTKIGVGLLSSLEHNDLSQWPKGIFRRAFLRSYTRAINIPFEPTWAEFIQLFPEDGGTPSLTRAVAATELRLTLAASPARLAVSTDNLKAATADLAVVMAAAVVGSFVGGLSLWTSLAASSVLYATLGTALAGGSPARRYLGARVRHQAAPGDHNSVSVQPAAPEHAPLTLEERRPDLAESPAALPRPRIVAIPSTRAAGGELRERRVADR